MSAPGLVTELVAKGTTLQHAADYVWQLFARSEVNGKSWAEEAEVAMSALRDALRDHAPVLTLATPEAVRKADAAPELYAALKAEEYARRLAHHPESQMQAPVAREYSDDMREAAIAKAEGKP